MLSKSQSRAWGVPGVSSSIWGPQLGAAPSSLCHRWLRALGDVPSPSWVHLGCHGHPSRPSPRPRGCPPVCLSHRFLSVLPTLAACPVVTTLSPLPGGGLRRVLGWAAVPHAASSPRGAGIPWVGCRCPGDLGHPQTVPVPPPSTHPGSRGPSVPSPCVRAPGVASCPRALPVLPLVHCGRPGAAPDPPKMSPSLHPGTVGPRGSAQGVCVWGGVGGQGCAQPWGSALGPLLLPQRGRGSGIWTVRRGDATGTPSWSQVGGVWGGTRLLVLPWGGGVGGC